MLYFITTVYNAEEYIDKCIGSVLMQTNQNYTMLIIDDHSTDSTYNRAEPYCNGQIMLMRPGRKQSSLRNVVAGIQLCEAKKEDIIAILDGDDWLATNQVVNILEETYKDPDCWLTYGSYKTLSSGERGVFARQIPLGIIEANNYRQSPWMTSHLRTFKKGLFDYIPRKHFLDGNGEFFNMAGDLALMFPLLELSGHHSRFINEILYVYNDLNQLNEHKINHPQQLQCEHKIRTIDKLNNLESL